MKRKGMEACSLPRALPLLPSSFPPKTKHHPISQFPNPYPKSNPLLPIPSPLSHSKQPQKGFGPKKPRKQKRKDYKTDDKEEDDEQNGFFCGNSSVDRLLFFPFFYYLKVGLKIGCAHMGALHRVFYLLWDSTFGGQLWDCVIQLGPHEGRLTLGLMGWTEAKKNGPVFWQSIWNGSGKK